MDIVQQYLNRFDDVAASGASAFAILGGFLLVATASRSRPSQTLGRPSSFRHIFRVVSEGAQPANGADGAGDPVAGRSARGRSPSGITSQGAKIAHGPMRTPRACGQEGER